MARVILGRYELTERLGHGGMGEVWAAHDADLDRPVAVKLLAPRGQGAALATLEQRFLREARLTARLTHAGVPVIHDVGQLADGQLYLLMELVPGSTLSALMARDGRFPVERAVEIAAQTADALAYAHGKGVIHRDLKPPNLMLTPEGAVKVLDFGIAAALHPRPDDERLTGTHATPGTPGFMAPEQAEGQTTERSDLYALGCVLYEILAGVPPLTAANGLMLLYRHMHDPVPPLAERRPEVPAAIAELVMRLLAKDPADRPASAAEVRDLARASVSGPPSAVARVGAPGHGSAGNPGRPTDAARPQQPDSGAPITADLGRFGRDLGGPLTAAVRSGAVTGISGRLASPAGRSDAAASPVGPAGAALFAALTHARELAEAGDFAGAAAGLAPQLGDTALPPADGAAVAARLAYYEYVRRSGQPTRAHEGFAALTSALQGARPPTDRDLLTGRLGRARCLDALGRTPEALQEFEELLPLQERVLGLAAPPVLRMRQEIAVLVARTGDQRRAYDLLVRLHDDLRQALPADGDQLVRTRLLIARLERLLRETPEGA